MLFAVLPTIKSVPKYFYEIEAKCKSYPEILILFLKKSSLKEYIFDKYNIFDIHLLVWSLYVLENNKVSYYFLKPSVSMKYCMTLKNWLNMALHKFWIMTLMKVKSFNVSAKIFNKMWNMHHNWATCISRKRTIFKIKTERQNSCNLSW